jgi:hypothetical protein
MKRKHAQPPFDRLRANGSGTEIVTDFPFVLSLSKHERCLPSTFHLGKLYMGLDQHEPVRCPALTEQREGHYMTAIRHVAAP